MNARLLTLSLIVLSFLTCVEAQPVRFLRTFDFAPPTHGWDVIQTPDGGYLLFGGGPDSINGTFRIFLLKTDPKGNQVWRKFYGSSAHVYSVKLQPSSQGCYRLTGMLKSSDLSSGLYYPYWMIIDSNGRLVDSVSMSAVPLSFSVDASNEGLYTPIGDSHFLTVGIERPSDPYKSPSAIVITARSYVGDHLWTNRVSTGVRIQPTPQSCFVSSDGSITIIGQQSTLGLIWSDGCFVMHTSPAGYGLWTKIILAGPDGYLNYYVATQGKDSSLIMLGRETGMGTTSSTFATKFSSTGQVLFSRTCGPQYWNNTWLFHSVVETKEGGMAIAYSRNPNIPGGFVLVTTASGDTLSDGAFAIGPGAYRTSTIKLASDSDLVLIGTVDDSTMFFAKVNPKGVVTSISSPSVTQSDGSFQYVGSYPNPFNSQTRIVFQVGHADHQNVSIYNVLGQRVATLFDGHLGPGMHTVEWNAQDHSSGVFYCRIEVDSKFLVRPILYLK
jgi:hypothetical protein